MDDITIYSESFENFPYDNILWGLTFLYFENIQKENTFWPTFLHACMLLYCICQCWLPWHHVLWITHLVYFINYFLTLILSVSGFEQVHPWYRVWRVILPPPWLFSLKKYKQCQTQAFETVSSVILAIANSANSLCHLHWLKIWSLGGRFGHRVAPLVFVTNVTIRLRQFIENLATRYCHKFGLELSYWLHQMVFSWYLHQVYTY